MSEISQEQAERVAGHIRNAGWETKAKQDWEDAPGTWGLIVSLSMTRQIVVNVEDAEGMDALAAIIDALRAEGILPPPVGMVMVPLEMAQRLKTYADFAAPHYRSAGLVIAEEDATTLGKLVADRMGWEPPIAGGADTSDQDGEGESA